MFSWCSGWYFDLVNKRPGFESRQVTFSMLRKFTKRSFEHLDYFFYVLGDILYFLCSNSLGNLNARMLEDLLTAPVDFFIFISPFGNVFFNNVGSVCKHVRASKLEEFEKVYWL